MEAELEEKEQLRNSYKIEEEYKVDENELNSVELAMKHINSLLANQIADRETLVSRINKIHENNCI